MLTRNRSALYSYKPTRQEAAELMRLQHEYIRRLAYEALLKAANGFAADLQQPTSTVAEPKTTSRATFPGKK